MSDCAATEEDNLITIPNGTIVDPDVGLTPDGYYPCEVTNLRILRNMGHHHL